MRVFFCLTAALLAAPLAAQSVSLDPSFGANGLVELTPGTLPVALKVRVVSNGVLVAGEADRKASLVSLSSSGAPNASFGIAGVVQLDRVNSYITDVEPLADGRVLVLGSVTTSDRSTTTASFVARLAADGSLDATFGTDGYADITTADGFSEVELIALERDATGRIYALGSAQTANGATRRVLTARFTAEGARDASYGTGGFYMALAPVTVTDAVLLNDGRMVLVGTAFTAPSRGNAAIVRLGANGRFDGTFGQNGVTQTDLGQTLDSFDGLALDAEGRVVVVGTALNPSSGAATGVVARFTTSGALDTGFGQNGRVGLAPGGRAIMESLAIRPSGHVVVGGLTGSEPATDFFAAQLNADGTLDTGFDADGIYVIDLASQDIATDLALTQDGDVVVSGFQWANGGPSRILAVRLTTRAVASDGPPIATGLSLRHAGAHPARTVRLAASVDAPTALRVDLMDLQGRTVARLYDGALADGVTTFTPIPDLPAGLYLARAVATDGRTADLPVLVVR